MVLGRSYLLLDEDTPARSTTSGLSSSTTRRLAVAKTTPLTEAQLRMGARRLSYRAQQLASVAIRREFPYRLEPGVRVVVRNAFIESALAHSRAFAYFLAKRPREGDYHYSHFDPNWGVSVEPTGRIIGSVSAHLSHAAIGDPLGEPHPGNWPISELAVVLVGVFATFVEAQRSAPHHAWFIPDPAQSYLWLMSTQPLARTTVPSAHPKVGELTRELQAYLREQGYPVVADSHE